MATRKQAQNQNKLPTRSKDVPASVGVVYEVRDELKAEVRSVERRIEAMDSKFEARAKTQDSKLEQMMASLHRIQAIVEESRSENRIMLEALTGFVQRMDHLETRQDSVETTVHNIAKSKAT